MELEKVIYFAAFIVTKVNEEHRQDTLKQIEAELDSKRKQIESDAQRIANEIQSTRAKDLEAAKENAVKKEKADGQAIEALAANAARKGERLSALETAATVAKKELTTLKPRQIIAESQYHDLSLKYGHVFEAGIGAEAIHHLLRGLSLDNEIKVLEGEKKTASEVKAAQSRPSPEAAEELASNSPPPRVDGAHKHPHHPA